MSTGNLVQIIIVTWIYVMIAIVFIVLYGIKWKLKIEEAKLNIGRDEINNFNNKLIIQNDKITNLFREISSISLLVKKEIIINSKLNSDVALGEYYFNLSTIKEAINFIEIENKRKMALINQRMKYEYKKKEDVKKEKEWKCDVCFEEIDISWELSETKKEIIKLIDNFINGLKKQIGCEETNIQEKNILEDFDKLITKIEDFRNKSLYEVYFEYKNYKLIDDLTFPHSGCSKS